MPGIAWLRSRNVEVGWFAFAGVNVAAMILWPSWETIPFHFVWISLTIVYGFRVWNPKATGVILGVIIVVTGASIMTDAFEGIQLWGELFEVPLMSAMFLAMVWHARRRQTAVEALEGLLERQEQFLNDISHELRTPVTIAQGHLELLQRQNRDPAIAIALDELGRIERIIARLLLLAKTGHATFLAPTQIDVEQFLEDIFVRWSEVAPRSWRLGPIVRGTVWADEEVLRAAMDALVENAVKFTEAADPIELRARLLDFGLVIDVIDGGPGIDPDKTERIFERFGRGDDARTRTNGGVGLGLAIVQAVAHVHGGSCVVASRPGYTVFSLRLPSFQREVDLSPLSPEADYVVTT
jgi:two-component system, OmpR family, sensor kinase